MKSILVVGSAALDTIETPWGGAQDALGGSAVYFTVAASLFAPVNVVAVVGSDFPRTQLDFLAERQVDLSGLEVIPGGRSFRWHGRYHHDPNQRDTLATELNVFESFQPKIPASYRNSPLLFLANIDPDLQLQVLEQVENPELVILDTMNFWIQNKPEALRQVVGRCDIIIVNDAEVRELTGEVSLIKGGRSLARLGPRVVIIKKGEHGALMLAEDQYFFAPAFPLETVLDPTGAGDSFAGGFTGYLARAGEYTETEFRRAMVYGSAVASFTVEDFSLRRLQTLDMPQVKERYLYFRRLTEFS
jgi:sugar/nucleoside kinase (ribokinase family)